MDEENYYKQLTDRYREYQAMPFAPWETDLFFYANINYNLSRLQNLARTCWERDVTQEITECLDELSKYESKITMITETVLKDLMIEDPVMRREKALESVHKIFRLYGKPQNPLQSTRKAQETYNDT